MKLRISEEHVINALEGYLKAMTMIADDDIILNIKRTRTGEYELEVETYE